MSWNLVLPLALLVATAVFLRPKSANSDIDQLPGPKSPSWLIGNLYDLYHLDSGVAFCQWAKKYGGVVRCRGLLGKTFLSVSDPLAILHIFGSGAKNFEQSTVGLDRSGLLWGQNILSAAGTDHVRHRRAMQPAFNALPTKMLLADIAPTSRQLCKIWSDLIAASEGSLSVMDVSDWMRRLTFDALTKAGFSTSLETLAVEHNPTLKSYTDLIEFGFANRSPIHIFIRESQHRLPKWGLRLLGRIDPKRRDAQIRTAIAAKTFAAQILKKRMLDIEEDASVVNQRDMLATLHDPVRANEDEDARFKLNNAELQGQVGVLLLAGHETTATAMSWALYELAQHPEVQARLRTEIRYKDQELQSSSIPFTTEVYESLPYLNAVIKECLRIHPVLPNVRREALSADVLPLSQPLALKNNIKSDHIKIPAGTVIEVDIVSMNLSTALWGDDAEKFRPERWLDEKVKLPRSKTASLYEGLGTFIAGPRGCLGWRFSVLEMQVFLCDIFRQFEFARVPEITVRKNFQLVSAPKVAGEEHLGAQLPLIVKMT